MAKGQTEDIFADLIPSILILVIAAFFLSSLSEKQVDKVENRILELRAEQIFNEDFQFLFHIPLEKFLEKEITGEFQKNGDDVSQLTLPDAIRLSFSKEQKYAGSDMHLSQYLFQYVEATRPLGIRNDWDRYVIFTPIAQAMKILDAEMMFLEIDYPDGTMKKMGTDYPSLPIQAQISIPDKNGKSIIVKIKGKAGAGGTTGGYDFDIKR